MAPSSGSEESLHLLRKDQSQLAASVSALVDEMVVIRTERAVEVERDKNLKERLDRIEDSIKGLYGIGRWFLIAFFGALVAAFVTFVVRGGMNVPPTP